VSRESARSELEEAKAEPLPPGWVGAVGVLG